MSANDRQLFSAIRNDPFGGRLTEGQVRGINAILGGWRRMMPKGDPRHLAYMLATAFHETV